MNQYQLCLAEAIVLGYSIGTGKPVEGLKPKLWRGEFAQAYKALVSGKGIDVPLATYFRHIFDVKAPMGTLVQLVKREQELWHQLETKKRLKEAANTATAEQLAQALAILEGKAHGKEKQLPHGVEQPTRPAPQDNQRAGKPVQQAQAMANVPRAGQGTGAKQEQHRVFNGVSAAQKAGIHR